jgi:hypothetical protein
VHHAFPSLCNYVCSCKLLQEFIASGQEEIVMNELTSHLTTNIGVLGNHLVLVKEQGKSIIVTMLKDFPMT